MLPLRRYGCVHNNSLSLSPSEYRWSDGDEIRLLEYCRRILDRSIAACCMRADPSSFADTAADCWRHMPHVRSSIVLSRRTPCMMHSYREEIEHCTLGWLILGSCWYNRNVTSHTHNVVVRILGIYIPEQFKQKKRQ